MKTIYEKVKEKYPRYGEARIQEIVDYLLEFQDEDGVTEYDEILDKLRDAEETEEAQNFVKMIMAFQEFYKAQFGKYAGSSNAYFTLKHPTLDGLTFSLDEYVAPDGEVGYTIKFSIKIQGYEFVKMIGHGSQGVNQDWIGSLINEE